MRDLGQYVEHAVAGRGFPQADVHYVVRDGRVTCSWMSSAGRILPDRSWRDGLHQAVEAKEGLLPSGELKTAARVSRQRYFRLYKMICGMTGTATGNEAEFWRLYRLQVVPIPLCKPCRRQVLSTRFFRDAESKWRAITKEVSDIHSTGRPVLIGSRTIENSELLARRLETAGVPFHMLNGKQDRQEADIVAMAGHCGARDDCHEHGWAGYRHSAWAGCSPTGWHVCRGG